MHKSIQNIEKKLIHAQQYLNKGEIDNCYNLCLEIEEDLRKEKKDNKMVVEELFQQFKNQHKEILKKLNQQMVKGIQQKI